MQQKTTYAPRYTVADAFSGCGGLSLGFALTGRYDIVFGTDIKPEALATFAANHTRIGGRRPLTIEEDIAKLDGREVSNLLRTEGAEALDCLIGGPPCEGFSQNRTQLNGARVNKFIDDPRNSLFRWFVNLAATLRPKVVVIENVPDLIRHRDGETRDEVFTALDAAGYAATATILNAANYGVPQMRRRAFFLAQRKEDLARCGIRLGFPRPTHQPYPMMHESLYEDPEWLPGDSGYWVTVREAIGDLPAPTSSTAADGAVPAEYGDSRNTTFRALMRARGDAIYNHVARNLGKNGLARLRALRPGQIGADLPDELRPKSHFHYSYTRLIWSEPARTITKFAYHVGSGQFGHPSEDRAMTMREAARLQSFPDDFRFVGTSEIRALSSMVGSAVPPLLARALAKGIAQYLDALHLASMSATARRAAKTLQGDAVLRRLENGTWGSNGQLEMFPTDE